VELMVLYVTKTNSKNFCVYIYFFFSVVLNFFSLVVLHLDLLFPPILFLLALVIAE